MFYSITATIDDEVYVVATNVPDDEQRASCNTCPVNMSSRTSLDLTSILRLKSHFKPPIIDKSLDISYLLL